MNLKSILRARSVSDRIKDNIIRADTLTRLDTLRYLRAKAQIMMEKLGSNQLTEFYVATPVDPHVPIQFARDYFRRVFVPLGYRVVCITPNQIVEDEFPTELYWIRVCVPID